MNEAQRITEWVEQKKESAIALARAVWGFAEPNWRETQSAAAISAALEAEGFALERRPCGMETAFVATWGGEGPVIAFLGEYDALRLRQSCPAEEDGGGKVFFARAGYFDKVDAVFAWHPGPANYVSGQGCLALTVVLYSFKGRTAVTARQPCPLT